TGESFTHGCEAEGVTDIYEIICDGCKKSLGSLHWTTRHSFEGYEIILDITQCEQTCHFCPLCEQAFLARWFETAKKTE
ncbi:MAG: hypothetical protein V3W19_08050, partial [Desulfatiglandales bacterium]